MHVIVPHENMLNMHVAQQLFGIGSSHLPFHSSIFAMMTVQLLLLVMRREQAASANC